MTAFADFTTDELRRSISRTTEEQAAEITAEIGRREAINIAIYSYAGHTRRLVKDGFPCLDDAVEWAFHNRSIAHLERDADFEHSADFITKQGDVYAIQPKAE